MEGSSCRTVPEGARGFLTGAAVLRAAVRDTLRAMRRVRAAAVLAAVLAGVLAGASGAAPAVAGPAGAAAKIDREPEFVTRVNQAIERGTEWLKASQSADGTWPEHGGYPLGLDALVYHTIRVCGVSREDPVAVRAWNALRRSYEQRGRASCLQTYSAALVLMAIAEHGDRVRDPKSDREVTLSAADRDWADEITRWLVRGQSAQGTWTYDTGDDGPLGRRRAGAAYDHSNTQYALLGLKAAARCGIPVETRVWKGALDHFLRAQDTSGPEVLRFEPQSSEKGRTSAAGKDRARGWGYTADGEAYGSMTAGGVGSVVICRSELLGTAAMTQKLAADSERAAWDGLAWLGSRWVPDPLAGIGVGAPERPEPHLGLLGNGLDYYAFYGVERAGVLAGVDWMAELDWYGDGAEALLRRQSNDGGWPAGVASGLVVGGDDAAEVVRRSDSARRIADVCFALLFLKRGTSPVARGAVTQAPDASDIRFDLADGLPAREFEDLLDLVLSRWIRFTDDRARAALFDGAVSMGPRIVPPLLVRLDSGDSSVRGAADALLRRATAQSFGFDAAADRPARDDAAMRWQSWWLGVKDRLRYDPDRGLLVVPAAR